MNVRAQGARNTAAQPPATAVANAAANDNTKRAMTIADIGKWRTIRDVAISDDGQWASYGYQQRRVDDTLFVKQLPAGAEQKIPRASRAQFSDDSKWVAYFVARADPAERPAGATVADGGPAPTGPAKLELRNLATNAVVSWDNVGVIRVLQRLERVDGAQGARRCAARRRRRGGRGGGAVDAAERRRLRRQSRGRT